MENAAEVSTSNNLSISSTTSTPMEVEKNISPSAPSTLSTPVKVSTPMVRGETRRRDAPPDGGEPSGGAGAGKAGRRNATYGESQGGEKCNGDLQQEGRLPGRKRLMEKAGVSEWEARKILQELRKKVG